MPEAQPADAAEGQAPEGSEGQAPDDGDALTEGQKPESKTYSEAYVKQLRREAAGQRTRLAELETQVEELTGKGKSEQEKLIEKLTGAESRAMSAETKLLRYEVAAERGLDLSAAQFLTGATREEIELRADELGKLLKDKAKPAASFDGGARRPAPDTRKPEEQHNDLILQSLGLKRDR